MTYKDRVQKKAEEMAKVLYPKTFESAYQMPKARVIAKMLPLAEMAVKAEGEAFEQGWRCRGDESRHYSMYEEQSQLGFIKTDGNG